MRFEVKVSRYGDRWLISAPAFGVANIVAEETALRDEAHRMISQCGAAPARFEIELVRNVAADDDHRPGPPVGLHEVP